MTRSAWHTERDGACTTVARHWPARFDVRASAQFPAVNPARLAHQIRQDMWRALQNLRGFSPVVQVEQGHAGGLTVTAGGRACAPVPAKAAETIEALLQDAQMRNRWIKCAQRRAAP